MTAAVASVVFIPPKLVVTIPPVPKVWSRLPAWAINRAGARNSVPTRTATRLETSIVFMTLSILESTATCDRNAKGTLAWTALTPYQQGLRYTRGSCHGNVKILSQICPRDSDPYPD